MGLSPDSPCHPGGRVDRVDLVGDDYQVYRVAGYLQSPLHVDRQNVSRAHNRVVTKRKNALIGIPWTQGLVAYESLLSCQPHHVLIQNMVDLRPQDLYESAWTPARCRRDRPAS
jgi:hypothetical protein